MRQRRLSSGHGKLNGLLICLPAVLLVALGGMARPALAQQEPREYPPREYYLAKQVFYEGDFGTALRAFRSAGKLGIRSTEGRWVDSICYHTMMGECYFQMGQHALATEQYTAALQLVVAHQLWMLRVEFPPNLEPQQTARRPVNWANRRVAVGRFANRYPILQGRFDNDQVIARGGVVALPQFVMINAHEIARCSAVAIRRRQELLGVTSEHDPLTAQVQQALGTRPARQNHWSQAWIDVQLGLAELAAGRQQQAATTLTRGITAANQFDHPLTATALMALGRIAFDQKQYGNAARFFMEASVSAGRFFQYDLVEESLRWASITHIVTGGRAVLPALQQAASWARRDSRLVEASMQVAAAEHTALLNDTKTATGLTESARRRMARSEMSAGSVGARLQYVTSLVNYQSGNIASGDKAFAALMAYQRKSSTRLFEIGLVDSLYGNGSISDRVANELYGKTLRDPLPADWAVEPVETLSVVLTPHSGPLERWMEVALKRKEVEQALEIADRIRRHRFYTTLPMGGRLMAFRWVLEAPPAVLSEQQILQRNMLLESYPRYQQLSQQAAAIREAVRGGDLVPEDDEARRNQAQQLGELSKISTTQEVMLREMALRRDPSEFVFPPPLDFKKLQAQIPEGRLIVAFLATSKQVHAFAMGRETYQNWQVGLTSKVGRQIAQFLRLVGQFDRNQPVDAKGLLDESWKVASNELLRGLTNDADASVWDEYDELIIVPDGPLWYLPFETLQVGEGDDAGALITKLRIRYVPTVALAVPDGRGQRPDAQTAVVAGRLYPQQDKSVAEQAVADLSAALPGVVRVSPQTLVPTSLLAAICERAVVLTDIDERSRGHYGWSPLSVDRGKPGSTLSDWMALPFGGPKQIVLPGFHTQAEVGLKRGGTGSEVFLTVCGLMSTGCRTILISRWRPGGQSSYDLVREFAQELPYTSAADAWQRSLEIVVENDLVLEGEPRVKVGGVTESLKSEHPFFWGAFLLVDTGAEPAAE